MGQSETAMGQAVKTMTMRTGKYLTFSLAQEAYGIGILMVKEIIGMMPITRIPRSCEFVKGVINLRGKVIPVIDLRVKFNMAPAPYDEKTCIIVVETDTAEAAFEIGMIVDSVSEVLNINEGEIEDAPVFGAAMDTRCILGIAKTEQGVKILLDMGEVLSAAPVHALDTAV